MIRIEANNINDIQLQLFSHLKTNGEKVVSRNMEVLEVYPVLIKLTNINNRCTTLLNRQWNYIFALGEFTWHLSKSNELKFINYYTRNWNIASDDGISIQQSCYGKKLFETSTWSNLIKELTDDNGTRRAVINLYENDNTLGLNLRDVSCTIALQFIIRDAKLDLIVNMRSNDIMWGLPNDIFVFTMIQEMLSRQIGIDSGNYYHQINSLHVYKRHYRKMGEILDSPEFFDFTMPDMTNIDCVKNYISGEKSIRENKELDRTFYLDSYWTELLNVLKLRSTSYSNFEKKVIIENSKYQKLIKLIPQYYIMNENSFQNSAINPTR